MEPCSEAEVALEQGIELYNQNGVIMRNHRLKQNEDICTGTLSIVQYGSEKFFEWRPTEVSVSSDSQDHDWTVVSKVSRKKEDGVDSSNCISIDIKNIKEYRVHKRNKQKIAFTLKDNVVYGAVFQTGNVESLIAFLRRVYRTKRSSRDQYSYLILEEKTTHKSFCDLQLDFNHKANNPSEAVWRFMKDFQNKPVVTTLQTFSRITDFYKPTESLPLRCEAQGGLPELLSESVEGVTIEDEYQLVGPKYPDLPPRAEVTRGEPLTVAQWMQHADAEGRITNPEEIKRIVFQGGVCDTLRYEVWKFLLDYFPWNATTEEQQEVKKVKGQEYIKMKLQWQDFTPAQEENFSDFRDRKSLIEKDVCRCDRSLPFYAGDDNPNLKALYNLLMTHVMYNFDLGYVQGMSDLLSPILFVMKNEIDAFWCFASFIEKVVSNFDVDQGGMKRQLKHLHELLFMVDPHYAKYLSKLDSNYLFCFRWLLVLFKREFSYEDIMTLWEALWTGLPGPNFHLFIGVAILDNEKSAIMKNNLTFSEALKHINELALKIDVKATLNRAAAIYNQFLAAEEKLPLNILRIMGLAPPEKDSNSVSDCESAEEPTDSPNSRQSRNGLSQSDNDDTENNCYFVHPDEVNFENSIMLHYM